MRNIKDKKTLSLTQAEKQALSELLSFLKTKWSLARFILFGSKVRGTSDKESDLDLLVILPCKVTEGIRRQIIYKVFEVNLAHGSNISILIVSAEEWEKGAISVLPIHAFIEEEGVSL